MPRASSSRSGPASTRPAGGVVCYIDRDLGGSSIRQVRLVAAGLSRTWTAPAPHSLSTAAPANDGPGAYLGCATAAAKWIGDTLDSVGLRRLAALCLDADGSVCTWLSAPSDDPAVIQASIAQAAQDAGTDGNASGLGAGRLLSMAASGGGDTLSIVPDTCVQALSTGQAPDAPSPTPQVANTRNSAKRTSPADAFAEARGRYAVLAVPDAPARVLLDQLDASGISVDAVLSLWHAAAAAWGPPLSPHEGDPGTLESDQRTTAVIMIDPVGQLVWSWCLGPNLLAGGTLRLSRLMRRLSDDPAAQVIAPGQANELARANEPVRANEPARATLDNARRRASDSSSTSASADDAAGGSTGALEFTRADAGRLALDFLAWSVQLGTSPDRLVCLATPNLTDADVSGAPCLARACSRAWPGATIDAFELDDPVQSTIARIAGLGDDRTALAPLRAGAPLDDSGSASLLPLSNRASRANRSMYRFAALGLGLLSVVVALLGWRLHQAAGSALEASGRARNRFTDAVTNGPIKDMPDVANAPGNSGKLKALEDKVNQMRDSASKVRPPRPVLAEAVRALNAFEGFPQARVTEIDFIAASSGSINLQVPDAETGPAILTKLRSLPGALEWTGTVPGFGGAASTTGTRTYRLTGLWPSASQPEASPQSPRVGGSK
jgi:hypothetical protein